MKRLSTTINQEDKMKLQRRAARLGMTVNEAAKVIMTKGVAFFLSLLIGATKDK